MSSLHVTICTCTYKRPNGLRALLGAIAAQTFHGVRAAHGLRPQVDILVVDNEGSETTRAICSEFKASSGLTLTYVHEPRRGIAFARNACLDHLAHGCEFVAMIDDDEVPDPDWLDQLLAAQAATGADIVQGRVIPAFARGASAWIVNGQFFGRPRRLFSIEPVTLIDLQELHYAGAGNALVRADSIHCLSLRFDPGLALSGGEDTKFFGMMHSAGCRIVYADRAVVHEDVPQGRANLRYMTRERFRMANTRVFLKRGASGTAGEFHAAHRREGIEHVAIGLKRIVKTAASRHWRKDRFAIGVLRLAYGLGAISGSFGYRYQHYK